MPGVSPSSAITSSSPADCTPYGASTVAHPVGATMSAPPAVLSPTACDGGLEVISGAPSSAHAGVHDGPPSSPGRASGAPASGVPPAPPPWQPGPARPAQTATPIASAMVPTRCMGANSSSFTPSEVHAQPAAL